MKQSENMAIHSPSSQSIGDSWRAWSANILCDDSGDNIATLSFKVKEYQCWMECWWWLITDDDNEYGWQWWIWLYENRPKCNQACDIECWCWCWRQWWIWVGNRVAQVVQSCKPGFEDFSNLWGFLWFQRVKMRPAIGGEKAVLSTQSSVS